MLGDTNELTWHACPQSRVTLLYDETQRKNVYRGVFPVEDDLRNVVCWMQKVVIPPLIPLNCHCTIFVHTAKTTHCYKCDKFSVHMYYYISRIWSLGLLLWHYCTVAGFLTHTHCNKPKHHTNTSCFCQCDIYLQVEIAAGNWIKQCSGDVALAEQADYWCYYLLQDRGPDMTPPYSETSEREEETDRQKGG